MEPIGEWTEDETSVHEGENSVVNGEKDCEKNSRWAERLLVPVCENFENVDEPYCDILKPIDNEDCLLYTSPSPRDLSTSRMPSSA